MEVKRLVESRELLNLKQNKVAEIMNVSNSTVSGWETGRDTIPFVRLIEYANKFNYSLDYLFGISSKNKLYENINLNLEELSENLKLLRKKNNKTQIEVAKFLNTSQGAYSHYECGTNIITTTFIFALTNLYKPFSVDSLLNRKPKK